MKGVLIAFLLSFTFLFCGSNVFAVPLGLSGFTADDEVSVSGGQVDFAETFNYCAWYFYNDNFDVPGNATILFLNYDFQLEK